MRIAIEPWSAEYGAPVESAELTPTDADVDATVELAPAAWRPLDPPADADVPGRIVFVDGVRRVEARVWITTDEGATRLGVCASYAAGCVSCEGHRAQVERAEVRRGLFAFAGAPDLASPVGTWHARAVASDDVDRLIQGVQERMAELEREVAVEAADGVLLVLDGPLTGKLGIPGAVGYVKTHRVSYLPQEIARVVGDLAAGQRTPLFVTQSSWSRYSWYLRLPGPGDHPWSGIVRCEASADLPLAEARRLADSTAAALPRFASRPHKDPRAPQNLYPIAGLERALRRRLGDAAWVLRGIMRGAAPRQRQEPG